MTLPFPGDVSIKDQKIAMDYFLDALVDPDFDLKIKDSDLRNLNEAYTRSLRPEMIRIKHGKHAWVVDADTSRLVLNQEYQCMIEEL